LKHYELHHLVLLYAYIYFLLFDANRFLDLRQMKPVMTRTDEKSR